MFDFLTKLVESTGQGVEWLVSFTHSVVGVRHFQPQILIGPA